MKFTVFKVNDKWTNRYPISLIGSSALDELFTADIDADNTMDEQKKVNLAIKWALSHRNTDLKEADIDWGELNAIDTTNDYIWDGKCSQTKNQQ